MRVLKVSMRGKGAWAGELRAQRSASEISGVRLRPGCGLFLLVRQHLKPPA